MHRGTLFSSRWFAKIGHNKKQAKDVSPAETAAVTNTESVQDNSQSTAPCAQPELVAHKAHEGLRRPHNTAKSSSDYREKYAMEMANQPALLGA